MHRSNYSVTDLVDELLGLGPDALDAGHVGAILTEMRPSEQHLAPYLSWCSERYTRTLLFRNAGFELLALCWDRGSGSPIHDHGQSNCFMSVQTGMLHAEDYAILEGGGKPGHAIVDRIAARTLVAGDLDVRSLARDVHRVSSRERTVSFHVYAKPLEQFLIFDQEAHCARRMQSRYDCVRLVTPKRKLVA